jgi:glycerophosphoryl diester phosphodiesterase
VRRLGLQDAPFVVAHRGASSTHPENTLSAFEAAIDLGAPFLELDVRRSRDGVPVVIHDATLERTTDGSGTVVERTAAELASLSAGTAATPASVPRLAEVLELASGRCGLLVEIKDLPGQPGHDPRGATVRAAVAELDRVGFDGPFAFISFDPSAIGLARELAPEVSTGLLFTRPVEPDEALVHATEARHDVLLPGTWVLEPVGRAFVERAHDAGMLVVTWVVDDPAEVMLFFDLGVDGVASNDPAAAVAARR